MVSKEHKIRAAALHEKLQLLGSITNSHAVNESSIIVDASKYIKELKEKVEMLNRDVQSSSESLPTVKVETLEKEKGFLINVYNLDKNCPGLLVFILEAFEDLNLNVIQARASCSHNFQLEANIIAQDEEEGGENVDSQAIKQAVFQAIRHWNQTTTTTTEQQDQ